MDNISFVANLPPNSRVAVAFKRGPTIKVESRVAGFPNPAIPARQMT
jgi:hypothetical protein